MWKGLDGTVSMVRKNVRHYQRSLHRYRADDSFPETRARLSQAEVLFAPKFPDDEVGLDPLSGGGFEKMRLDCLPLPLTCFRVIWFPTGTRARRCVHLALR